MRARIMMLLAITTVLVAAHAQVREVWRYRYTPSEPGLMAQLERVMRLEDGSLLILGWTETPMNGQDALAIKLLPSGTPAWVYQQDGAGFNDAFVDAMEYNGTLWLLGRFTNEYGKLEARLLNLSQSGQQLGETILFSDADAHHRPLSLVNFYDGLLVYTERIANGRSQLLIGGHANPIDLRPWGVIFDPAQPESDPLVVGTVATPFNALDAVLFVDFRFYYSGPAGGFDIPIVGAAQLSSQSGGYWVGVQSEGSYTGEDIVLMHFTPWLQLRWGFRYTNTLHDDFAESLTVDSRGNAYLLARVHYWAGEPFEQRTLRLLKFNPQGALVEDVVIPVGNPPGTRPHLSGIIRLNAAGQRFVAANQFLARVGQGGQLVWFRTPPIRFDALIPEADGSLIAAGEESLDDGFIQRILTVIKYAPNGDLDGNGCVDDADLLRLLLAFGQSGADLAEDLNGDGVVDDADLLEVLFHFGSGC
jgi:hypothetical protein